MVRFGAKKEESFLLFYFTKKRSKLLLNLFTIVRVTYTAASKFSATTFQSITLKKAFI